jgi:predicted ATP-grasp superfamily ATP-dependent carboligase
MEQVLRFAQPWVTDLRSPVMVIALRGWFDMGSTATAAVNELATGRTSTIVAEIDPDPFYDFTQERPLAEIRDGLIRVIVWPENNVELSRGEGRDLVILRGVEPHLGWRTYTDAIAEIAITLGCEAVVTVGAAAEAVPHTRTPLVTGSTTNTVLAQALGLSQPSYQGVTGVVGVLQATLDDRSIPAISLRVGIPHYLANAEHPAAIAALHAHLGHVLGIPVNHDHGADIERWRSLHDEVVEADAQLRLYVQMLEQEHDRRAEASIPTAEDLGAQFEQFLREQRPEDL